MALKFPDSAVPMGDFSVTTAKYIDFEDGESLQEKLDNGTLGSGANYTAGDNIIIDDSNTISAIMYDDTEIQELVTKKQNKLIAGNNIEILDDNTINSINEIPEYLSADENKVLTVKLNTDTNTPKLEWEDVSATGTINVKVTENADNTDEIYKLDITQFDNDTQTTTTTTTPNLKGKDGVNGTDGTDGKDVTIKENADNNDTTYKLDITSYNEDNGAYETTTTPNLKGIDGVDGIDAKDITIKENADNNDTTYKLDITKWNEDTQTYETITTPNLRGNSLTNIEENANNTDTVYKLDITSFDNDAGEYTTITTPNLKQLVIPTSRPETLVNGAIWIE